MPAKYGKFIDFENLRRRAYAECGEREHKTRRGIEVLVERRAERSYYEDHQTEIYARFNQYVFYNIKYIFFFHNNYLYKLLCAGRDNPALAIYIPKQI